MLRRLLPTAVVAALLACGGITNISQLEAAETAPPLDMRFAVDESPDRPGLLTPDTAFRDGESCPPVVRFFPLLRIAGTPRQNTADTSLFYEAATRQENAGARTDLVETVTGGEASPPQMSDSPLAEQSARHDPFAGLQHLNGSPPDAIERLPRLMFMTVVVLGGCVGTLLIARRWMMRSGLVTPSQGSPRLQIVASLSIAPRSQLHIVRFDHREVLVGVDARGLQQIQVIPPAFEDVLQSSQERGAAAPAPEIANNMRGAPPKRRLFTAA